MRSRLLLPLIACAVLGAEGPSKAALRDATTAVASVLDEWHLAAAQSEEEHYFSLMAPDAVFLGIDEQERWSKGDFRKWAHPGFQARQIWSFRAIRRAVYLSPGGDVAWFDELLETSTMGKARGTGVLVKAGQGWLITQYVLSLPIPRPAFAEVRQVIQALQAPAPGGPKEVHTGK